jgi:hypothetical protein
MLGVSAREHPPPPALRPEIDALVEDSVPGCLEPCRQLTNAASDALLSGYDSTRTDSAVPPAAAVSAPRKRRMVFRLLRCWLSKKANRS